MNYKRIFILAAILGLMTYGILSWIKKPEIKNIDSQGANIIAFGDSLVYGVGASSRGDTDMFSLVSKSLGVNIINKGVSGNTTVDGLARLERDVLTQDPKIVLVLLGGNDYLQKVSTTTTFSNLREIIQQIQDRGSAVVLVGVRGGVFVDRFEEDYERLSKEMHTGYIKNILDGIITNRKLMSDSVHPNDRGYEIIALRVTPILRAILEERGEI